MSSFSARVCWFTGRTDSYIVQIRSPSPLFTSFGRGLVYYYNWAEFKSTRTRIRFAMPSAQPGAASNVNSSMAAVCRQRPSARLEATSRPHECTCTHASNRRRTNRYSQRHLSLTYWLVSTVPPCRSSGRDVSTSLRLLDAGPPPVSMSRLLLPSSVGHFKQCRRLASDKVASSSNGSHAPCVQFCSPGRSTCKKKEEGPNERC